MSFCGQCGFQLEEGAKFCPSCGQPLGQAALLSKATLVKGSSLPRHEGISYAELLREKIKIIIPVSVGLVLLVVVGWEIFFKPLNMYDYEQEVKKVNITWMQSIYALERTSEENYHNSGSGIKNQKALKKYIISSKEAMKQLSSLRAPKEYKTEDVAIKEFAKHYTNVDLKKYEEKLNQESTMGDDEYLFLLINDNYSGAHYRATNKYENALINLGLKMRYTSKYFLTVRPENGDNFL